MTDRNTTEQAEYFSFPVGGIQLSACMYCKHKSPEGAVCEAFPDGIPEEILAMENDHTEPFPGDNGIQFEPEIENSNPVRLEGGQQS